MKSLFLALVITAVVFAAADLCPAQEDAILLEDGTTLVGTVVSSDENGIKFRYQADGKETVATFGTSEIDPYSYYDIRSQAVGNDAKAHLALALFALDHDMLTRAYMHAQRARALDPAMMESFDREKKDQVVEGAAARILAKAEKAIERRDWEAAESNLSSILTYFHMTKTAEKAKKLIVEVGGEIAKQRAEREAESIAKGTVEVVDGKPVTTVILSDGKKLRGLVLETANDHIKFQYAAGGGRVTVTLETHKVDPVSFFRIRRSDIGDDAAAHLDLAFFCIENGLFTRAYFQYETAKSLDPEFVADFEKERLPFLRDEIASDLLKSARSEKDRGQFHDAERNLALILTRFPDSKAAGGARTLLEELDADIMKRSAAETAEIVAKAEEAEKEAEQSRIKELEPARKQMARAREVHHKALQNTNQTQGTKELESAVKIYEGVMRDLQGLAKKHEADAKMKAHIDKYYREAQVEAVGSCLDAGNILIFRNAFTKAMEFADKAIAIDPENSEAHSFKARVQVASAAAAGEAKWGGRRVRPR